MLRKIFIEGKKMKVKQVHNNIKALYDFGDYFIGYSKGSIYKCHGKNKEKICNISISVNYILCKNRLAERIFRLIPRCAEAIDKDHILISYKGGYILLIVLIER